MNMKTCGMVALTVGFPFHLSFDLTSSTADEQISVPFAARELLLPAEVVQTDQAK